MRMPCHPRTADCGSYPSAETNGPAMAKAMSASIARDTGVGAAGLMIIQWDASMPSKVFASTSRF